jgi:hypothetical protein
MAIRPPTNLKAPRLRNVALAMVFMILLWLPTLDTFFHFDQTPAFIEKRLPAQFPRFKPGLAGLKEYIVGLEAYFNDHFGCRNQLISWHLTWTHDVFRNSGSPDVLVGKDGWLYWAGGKMADHYRGIIQLTPQDLENWKILVERRRDKLAREGIEYIFVVAPDKQSIYPEYLPDWLIKVRPETKLDQFLAYMRAHSTVKVLDLRPALREAKKTFPPYLKADTHWNFFGGFVASEEIIEALSKQSHKLKALSLDSFELTSVPKPGGDLAMLLGANITEQNAIFLKPKTNLPSLAINANPVEKIAYRGPVFTKNPRAHDNAVVFHDSFGSAFEPFMGYHFREVVFIPRNELDESWIALEKPVVVVSEMVERNFNSQDPKELMKLEDLK